MHGGMLKLDLNPPFKVGLIQRPLMKMAWITDVAQWVDYASPLHLYKPPTAFIVPTEALQ